MRDRTARVDRDFGAIRRADRVSARRNRSKASTATAHVTVAPQRADQFDADRQRHTFERVQRSTPRPAARRGGAAVRRHRHPSTKPSTRPSTGTTKNPMMPSTRTDDQAPRADLGGAHPSHRPGVLDHLASRTNSSRGDTQGHPRRRGVFDERPHSDRGEHQQPAGQDRHDDADQSDGDRQRDQNSPAGAPSGLEHEFAEHAAVMRVPAAQRASESG